MIRLYEEAARCLLCKDGACRAACKHGYDPSRMIRAVRFENEQCAAKYIGAAKCQNCAGACESACVHYDKPLRIREMAAALPKYSPIDNDISLECEFLGVKCENPFFLSSSIVASSYEMCARAFDMGWAGVVYKTIGFIKPKEVSPRFDAYSKEGKPFIAFKNLEQISDVDLYENLEILRKLKQNYPSKVVVASIMGQNADEWGKLARLCTEAGVDIIECNFSCPHMTGEGLGSDVGQNPQLVAEYTAAVKANTTLPVLAKMTPNIGNMEIPAIAAVNAGADGLAAINTVKSIVGVDAKSGKPKMDICGKNAVSGLSGKAVKPIALRFIHDMAVCESLKGVPISGMGGIETYKDALDFLLLGSSNLQITTAVMQYGYRIIDDLTDGLKAYLAKHEIAHIYDLVGKSLPDFISPDELNRKSVVYPIVEREKCVGCGRCELSCSDAGHSAMSILDGKAVMNGKKCVGCQLCKLVCPIGAISLSKRTDKPE